MLIWCELANVLTHVGEILIQSIVTVKHASEKNIFLLGIFSNTMKFLVGKYEFMQNSCTIWVFHVIKLA